MYETLFSFIPLLSAIIYFFLVLYMIPAILRMTYSSSFNTSNTRYFKIQYIWRAVLLHPENDIHGITISWKHPLSYIYKKHLVTWQDYTRQYSRGSSKFLKKLRYFSSQFAYVRSQNFSNHLMLDITWYLWTHKPLLHLYDDVRIMTPSYHIDRFPAETTPAVAWTTQ